MAGIYIHIPFCKQACHYCNFHFSVNIKYKNDFLNALLQEIDLRADYLDEEIDTIYIGGGTPSLLEPQNLDLIFDKLYKSFRIKNGPEITLEANPDDLTPQNINSLRQSPVNRLSIGIQSFFDEDLVFLNRAHDSKQAKQSINLAQSAGFKNLTIDLIYGIQTLTNENWLENLSIAFNFNVPHISAYGLTIEPKTALQHFINSGKIKDIDDERVSQQFELLMEKCGCQGYNHYEISNFALPGFESKHNSSYWSGEEYIGLGPSAHSFNGSSRQWNVANNIKYIKSLQQGKLDFEKEQLTNTDRLNEFIMTSLRTNQGLDLTKAHQKFGGKLVEEVDKNLNKIRGLGLIKKAEDRIRLTNKGKLLADKVISNLFVVD